MRRLWILLLAGCATAPAGSVSTWEARARAVGDGRDGALAIPASESPALIWAAPGNILSYARSHDAGDSFPPPTALSGDVAAHGESAPTLKLGAGGEFVACWEAKGDILAARSTGFGRAFAPPVTLSDDGGTSHQGFPSMDADATGIVAAAWLDFREGAAAVYAAVSRDRGATFGKNVKIAAAVCPCCHPAILVGAGGRLHVAWRHVYEKNVRDLAIASSADGGATWSAPSRIAVDGWELEGCPHSGPALSISSGAIRAVWYTGAGNRSSLRVARSSDGGATWTRAAEIQGGLQDANHPHLVEAHGAGWVIFQARDGSEGSGWGPWRPWIVRLDAEDRPSAPQPLPALGGGIGYPRLFAGTAGRLYAVWTEGTKVVMCRGRAGS